VAELSLGRPAFTENQPACDSVRLVRDFAWLGRAQPTLADGRRMWGWGFPGVAWAKGSDDGNIVIRQHEGRRSAW
jgi:hypothetical protein